MKNLTERKPAKKSKFYDFVKNHICYQGKATNKRSPPKPKKTKAEKNKSKKKEDEESMINSRQESRRTRIRSQKNKKFFKYMYRIDSK